MATTVDIQSDKCPVCLNDKYLNHNLKLLVSPCFHKMCEACVSRIFNAGPAPCPICSTTLRKLNFIQQTFDDLYVEKEIQIRKKVGKFFNKRREDFPSLRDYNDYLEVTEDLLFNMINNVNVQETEERIEKFRLENKDLISKNTQMQELEKKALEKELNREKREKQLKREAYEKRAQEQEKLRKREAEELIDQLAATSSSTSNKELGDLIKASRREKKTGTNAFQKIKLVQVQVDDDDIDEAAAAQVEIEADFNPLEGIEEEEGLQYVSQRQGFPYSCSWNAPLIKEAGIDLLKAEGYSSDFTFARALHAVSKELMLNL